MSWRIGALALVFIWFFLGGIGHFLWLDAYSNVVPAWVPHPREVVLATGACDIAGAIAVLWTRTRRVGGLALIAYCLCVWPVHFEMLAHHERYASIPLALLWARLLFQPVLMGVIWWASFGGPPPSQETPKPKKSQI